MVSESSAALLPSRLPEGASLRSLGRHRLKDLTQPQEIFQLFHPALPADFPPLRSLEAFTHNLPLQLSSFIGRERETAEARRLLATGRLLTLTGPGGSGKTRLALQVAAEVIEELPDGVWLVELAALTDPSLLPQSIAAALGLGEEGGARTLTETLTDALRPKSSLLIWDNCEHLILACAHLAETLLRACPNLRLLATSREALEIAGEATLPILSLSLPAGSPLPPLETLAGYESIRLFVERATSAQPTFRFSAGNAQAVAQVCTRLDGIPLALELAAARVKALTPDQIAGRLDDRFRLLSGGSRTALPRQQTLRALIDWSYDLLPSAEKTLLRRLSVFSGGWTLEAAEAVCAGGDVEDWEALDLLSHLVAKSLVVFEPSEDGQGRYRLLENLRSYAAEALAETEDAAALPLRHRDWFLTLAEAAEPKLDGPEQVAWLNRLERDHDNLRAALILCREQDGAGEMGLRLAAGMHRFWFIRGYLSEGIQAIESALTCAEGAPSVLKSRALAAAGVLAWSQGNFPQATSFHKESLALNRELNDQVGIAHALTNLGILASCQREFETAKPLLEESLALYRSMNDRKNEAAALINLGCMALDQGDWDTSLRFLEESLAMYRRLKDDKNIANALHNLGEVARKQQRHAEAIRFFQESLLLQKTLMDRCHIAMLFQSLGLVFQSLGNDLRAACLLGAAEAACEAAETSYAALVMKSEETQSALTSLRAVLSPDQFEQAWNRGRKMALSEAIEYALRDDS